MRTIFYEGDDPEAFRKQMIEEFGFDPAKDPEWHTWVPWPDGKAPPGYSGTGFWNYGFECPDHAYQEVYASGRWPMGS